MTVQHIDEARAIIRAIIQRVVQDPGFAEHLRDDPRGASLAAGVPEWAVDDFIKVDLGLGPDVSGYAVDRCAVTSFLWIDEDGITAN